MKVAVICTSAPVDIVCGGVAVSAEFVRHSASRATKKQGPPHQRSQPQCGACLPPSDKKTWASSPCSSPSSHGLALSPDFTWRHVTLLAVVLGTMTMERGASQHAIPLSTPGASILGCVGVDLQRRLAIEDAWVSAR